jgi:hypothetical protein
MKRILILAAALALAPAAQAQLYKYVDKNGKTVYSDQPPANAESKQIHVPASRAAAAPPAGPKSAVERDKELDKSRKEVAEKQKKSDQAAERAAQAAQRCAQLRTAHQTFADGGRIQKYNDKGERELMSDEEIESERARTRREMEEACKTQ